MTGPSSSDQNPWLMSNKIRVYLRFFLLLIHIPLFTIDLPLFTSIYLAIPQSQLDSAGTGGSMIWGWHIATCPLRTFFLQKHQAPQKDLKGLKTCLSKWMVWEFMWFICLFVYGDVWSMVQQKKMVSHGSHGFTWFTCFFFETDPTLGPKIGRRLDRSQVRNKWNWSILGCALWIGADASHGEVATEVYKTFFAVHE